VGSLQKTAFGGASSPLKLRFLHFFAQKQQKKVNFFFVNQIISYFCWLNNVNNKSITN